MQQRNDLRAKRPARLRHRRGAVAVCSLTLALGAMSACEMEGELDEASFDDTEGLSELDTTLPDGLVADISVPTDDGAAAHRFQFVVDGDVIATYVDSPAGYPAPVIEDDCALDTYLRVAPDDAVVPEALLHICDPDGAQLRRAAAPTVAELRTDDHVLELAAASSEFCSIPAFVEREANLAERAAFIPDKYSCTPGECTTFVVWDQQYCRITNSAGVILDWCDPITAAFYQSMAPLGSACIASAPPSCEWAPNHACDHPAPVDSTYLQQPKWSMQRYNVTRVHLQVSGCGTKRTGSWQQDTGSGWGSKHTFDTGGDSYRQLTLSAGWTASDKWKGRGFRVTVNGGKDERFHAIAAWAKLAGKDRHECPLKL